MCRLLGAVTLPSVPLSEALREEFAPFTDQSEVHSDGWGIAWYDGPDARTPQLRRELAVARECGVYETAAREAVGPLVMVHLRKSSPTLPPDPASIHTFQAGDLMFCHNGYFARPDALRAAVLARGGRTPQGMADSELFLSLITVHHRTHPLAEAVQRAAAEICALTREHADRPPAALNCLITSPDELVAYCEYDPAQRLPHHADDNFVLRYRADADRVLVISSGLPQDDYSVLGQGEALVVDRETLVVRVVPPLEAGAAPTPLAELADEAAGDLLAA